MNSETNDKLQQVRWHVYAGADELVERAKAVILRIADEAISERGEFLLVLAGGTTPQRIYRSLADSPADWSRWSVYFGDERCLPPDHPERNSRMAADAWLSDAVTQGLRVFPMPAEEGPERAAAEYQTALQRVGTFDLVLLGLGEDGHTASLFPGHDWGEQDDAPSVLPVRGAPKPPPERVSLSAARLSAARSVMVLVTGSGKVDAVAGWRSGVRLPVTAIRPASGVDTLLSRDAWG
jgi:6-phosphogluconolactonase